MYYLFGDWISLCSPCSIQKLYIDQVGLELTDFCLLLSTAEIQPFLFFIKKIMGTGEMA